MSKTILKKQKPEGEARQASEFSFPPSHEIAGDQLKPVQIEYLFRITG